MPWFSAWPCGDTGPAGFGAARRRGATRLGAVCHAVVLPADIFIGGLATCNRLRGIRTERCFAHLYPRFTARPIQRQPSLSVFALSRSPPRLSSSPFLVHSYLSFISFLFSFFCAFCRRPLSPVCIIPLKRLKIILSDQAGANQREMTY